MKISFKTIVGRALAGVLVILFLGPPFIRFYSAPFMNVHNHKWLLEHSEFALWKEYEKLFIDRGMIQHDDFYYLHKYGSKSWAAKLIGSFGPYTQFAMCGGGNHLRNLTYITNHECENAAEWIKWWEKNGHLTQEQWILQGFAEKGFEIKKPFTDETALKLFELIGSKGMKGESCPDYMEFNAVRLLAANWLVRYNFVEDNLAILSDPRRLNGFYIHCMNLPMIFGNAFLDEKSLVETSDTVSINGKQPVIWKVLDKWPLISLITGLLLLRIYRIQIFTLLFNICRILGNWSRGKLMTWQAD